jgi:hypothetical protein
MKLEIEGLCLSIIKAIFDKPIANITLNGEKLKPSPPKVRNRTRMSLFPPLFNIILEFLDGAIRQDEEIKQIQVGKEEVKLSLFEIDMILYLKEPENSTKKTPRNYKHIWQSTRYNINL